MLDKSFWDESEFPSRENLVFGFPRGGLHLGILICGKVLFDPISRAGRSEFFMWWGISCEVLFGGYPCEVFFFSFHDGHGSGALQVKIGWFDAQ